MRPVTWILAALLLALAGPASAQTVGGPLQVRSGEVYTVDIHYAQQVDIGETPIETTARQVFALTIVDAEAGLWRYMPILVEYDIPTGAPMLEAASQFNVPALNQGLSALMRIATDIGFECRVDAYGRCMEMTNWPQWQARVENFILALDAFAQLAPGMNAQPAAEGEAAKVGGDWATYRGPVLRGFGRMVDNFDARDAASLMANIYMPAAVQGRTLTRRQAVNVIDEFEAPFGAPPIRFTGTVRLERIDRRANTGTVVHRVAMDRASARATAQGMVSFLSDALVAPLAAQSPKGEAPPTPETIMALIDGFLGELSLESTTTGTVDLATGMARETTTEFAFSMPAPGAEAGAEPLTSRARMVTRVTPGAPDTPRLPRGD